MKEQPLNVTALPGKPVLQGSGNPWHQVLEFSHQTEPQFPVPAQLSFTVSSPDQSSAASLSDHLILAPDFSCSQAAGTSSHSAALHICCAAPSQGWPDGTETW